MSEDDPTFKYKPTSCKALPNEEFRYVNGGKLLLPTFVDNTKVWDGRGNDCGAISRKACSELSADTVYGEVKGQCSCTLGEQFLVLNAGEQFVRFVYGYEVDTSNGKRQYLHRGGILSSTSFRGPEHRLEQQPMTLVTRFRAQDRGSMYFWWKNAVATVRSTRRHLGHAKRASGLCRSNSGHRPSNARGWRSFGPLASTNNGIQT